MKPESKDRMLRIDCCYICRYFDYDRKTDTCWCEYFNRSRIPARVDPSDDIVEWCPLPEAKP